MALEYKKAFDLITERVENELKKTGYTREKVASDDDNELVALFTSENVAYSVLYTVDRQLMTLRTCGIFGHCSYQARKADQVKKEKERRRQRRSQVFGKTLHHAFPRA